MSPRAARIALALTLATPLWATAASHMSPVVTDGCGNARFGQPDLVPFGRTVLVPVHGQRCGWVAMVDARTGAERRRFANTASDNTLRPDPYGNSVAVHRGRVLVGAPRTVYALDPRKGTVVQRYKSPGNTIADFEGGLAAVGGRVVVGAPFTGLEPDAPRPYGAVLVFDADSGTLERTALPAADSHAHSFGRTLARIDDRHVAVGTINAVDGISGQVHVLDITTGETVRTLLTPLGPDYAGSVAAARTLIIVGAPGNGTPTPGGSVYVFSARDGHIVRTIGNPGAANEAFGASLAVRGRRLLVLAPVAGDDTHPGGTAYLFDLRSGALRGRLAIDDDQRSGQLASIAFLRRGFAVATYAYGPPSELGIDYRDQLPR